MQYMKCETDRQTLAEGYRACAYRRAVKAVQMHPRDSAVCYPRDALHSAIFAVVLSLSVRPSV